MIGTTIEFFDFYIYATAAVLAFPRLFFPASDPNAARLASLATFVLFYHDRLRTVVGDDGAEVHADNSWSFSSSVSCFFAATIPISARVAERGRRITLIWVAGAIAVFGFFLAPLLSAGRAGATAAMIVGFSLIGLTYRPLGTVLSELFPTRVRYTGSSLTFNLAGIFGASLAPYIATWLAQQYGLQYVGYYLTVASVLTLVGLLSIHEARDSTL